MKPQGAKAKRTLADFLNRKNSESPFVDPIDQDTDAVASELLVPPALNAPKKTMAPRKAKMASKVEHKPEIDPAEKIRQREIQIGEATESAKQPESVTRKEAQARELLQGILNLAEALNRRSRQRSNAGVARDQGPVAGIAGTVPYGAAGWCCAPA